MNLSRAPSQRSSGAVIDVPLSDIATEDQRFQCRVEFDYSELRASLEKHGQQTPIILWRAPRPFLVIDGFRRIAAAKSLGMQTLRAVMRPDLTLEQAFALSFVVNSQRETLSPIDRARAVHRAINEFRVSKAVLAAEFSLSVRQVERYLRLFAFCPELKEAVQKGSISMAHALILHRAKPPNIRHWIGVVAQGGYSSPELRRELLRRRSSGQRTYLKRDGAGFRLKAIRYRTSMSHSECEQIREALWEAIQLVGSRPGGRHCEEAVHRGGFD